MQTCTWWERQRTELIREGGNEERERKKEREKEIKRVNMMC